MLCILYVIAVGTGLGIAGLLVERALPSTAPRRWIWCIVIGVSIAVPPIYRAKHTSSVTALLDGRTAGTHANHLASGPLTPLDPEFWLQLQSLGPIINKLWLISSALLIVWGLASGWKVSRLVRQAREDDSAPEVVDDIPVLVTDSVGPATVGLLRSRVLVPRWVLALPGVQRQYVLRHEEEHRRAHDGRLLFLMSLFVLLTPWNIALWWQLRRLSLAVELDCDNRVVAALGNPNAYGQLLLRVAEAGSRGPRLQPAFLGGAGSLERRLTSLLAPVQLQRAQRFLLPAAACAILFIVLSMPHPIR